MSVASISTGSSASSLKLQPCAMVAITSAASSEAKCSATHARWPAPNGK